MKNFVMLFILDYFLILDYKMFWALMFLLYVYSPNMMRPLTITVIQTQ